MTIGELIVLYEQNHVLNLKNWRNVSQQLARSIAPFGALPLGALTRMQVIQWHQEIGHTRGFTAANTALVLLHALYQKAQDWELYDGKNPAARVKKFTTPSRHRFIQANELPWLLKSLSEELPHVELFFLCLLLTGCRVGELRAAKWMDLDLERGLWHKPTTKNGRSHTVPLAAVLIHRLQQLPHHTAWVFPSHPNGIYACRAGLWSRTAIQAKWKRIRKRTGLVDVHIHDLRRTTASWLAISGANLPVIQQVLNHSSLAVTNVYARLSVAPVRLALDDQAERMLGLGSVPVGSVRDPMQEWPG
jgi:integrase